MRLTPANDHGAGPTDRPAAEEEREEEALTWLVRQSSGEMSKADREAFEHWHRGELNGTAYRRALRLWDGLLPILTEHDARSEPIAQSRPVPRRTAPFWMPLAASIALLAGGTQYYLTTGRYDQVSGTREQGAVARLADGSTIKLAPGTAFDVDLKADRRTVRLARGEAYFDVAHDASRPFIVETGHGRVQVLGTAFAVRKDDDDAATVTVTRGRVSVTNGQRQRVLTPDQSVRYGSAFFGPMVPVDASQEVAWTRGSLILENRKLGDVVDAVNRYSNMHLVLANKTAAQHKVNVVVDLQRLDGWLSVLSASQHLTVRRLGPYVLIS